MRINDIPFAVLRLQYRIARLPLQLIDDRLMSQLDTEAPVRLFYQRSLGTLDAKIGHALGDSEIRRQGVAARERSGKLARATLLDVAAEHELQQADADLKSARDGATTRVQQAQAATQTDVTDARDAAQRRKRGAEQHAKQRTAAIAHDVDEVAAHRKNLAEAARRQEEAKIWAEEQKATAAAKAKLDDAAAVRRAAADKRDQAGELEELADTEKRKRQSQRANARR